MQFATGRTSILALLLPVGLLVVPGCAAPVGVDTYTRVELKNPLGEPRSNELVEIPLEVVRARFPSFYEQDFSVHELPTSLYEEGDPMLALDPLPEIPAQLTDRDLDGELDTLLVSLSFGPRESKIVAVASPRYSRLMQRPRNDVHLGLWRHEVVRIEGGQARGEGSFASLNAALIPRSELGATRLYFGNGILFESDAIAYRLNLDPHLSLDVLGKRTPGLVLESLARAAAGTDISSSSGVTGLTGGRGLFGAGALGVAQGDDILPLESFNSMQYREIANGPLAAEAEILLTGCRLGEQAFDVKWHITAVRGENFLRHAARVSRTGHHLAFGIEDRGAEKRMFPSARLGWMRAMTYGPNNVSTGASGSLALGFMLLGRQSSGYGKEYGDVVGARFDSMLTRFQWISAASWSETPGGVQSLDDFQHSLEDLALRLNNPVLVRTVEDFGT